MPSWECFSSSGESHHSASLKKLVLLCWKGGLHPLLNLEYKRSSVAFVLVAKLDQILERVMGAWSFGQHVFFGFGGF